MKRKATEKRNEGPVHTRHMTCELRTGYIVHMLVQEKVRCKGTKEEESKANILDKRVRAGHDGGYGM